MPTSFKQIIQPIDLDPNTAVGISSILYPGGGYSFQLDFTTFAHAKSKLRMIIFTDKERCMRPNFGCNLKSILFTNDLNVVSDQIENIISQQVQQWAPEINIVSIQAIPSTTMENAINVICQFSMVYDASQSDSLTFTLKK